MNRQIGSVSVEVLRSDITQLDVDAIVNAANSDLWMGSGVAGAIRRKGGVEIETEALSLGPIRPGQAIITHAGHLPSRWVIHCAGMAPGQRATYENVQSSSVAALRIAADRNLRDVAFPAVGAGVGGLTPNDSAAAILDAVSTCSIDSGSVNRVILVAFDEEMERAFTAAVKEHEVVSR